MCWFKVVLGFVYGCVFVNSMLVFIKWIQQDDTDPVMYKIGIYVYVILFFLLFVV